MFGKNKNGYVVVKHTVAPDRKCVWHLNMRDDNVVFITDGYNIIGGRVHMKDDEAEAVYAKSCAEIGACK